MSGPEKQVEIEDVLSSIRRLVSEDEAGESDLDKTTGTSGDRLVLTPSLRVADELHQGDRSGPLTLDQRLHRRGMSTGGGPASTLTSRIAALESAIAETVDQWEPDGSVGDDYAGTNVGTIEWTDDESIDDTEVAAPDAADSDAQPLLLETAHTAMDDDALRGMVADIVREELQGMLGERITRNLRKMVRREIHRALSAQDLD